MAAASEFNMARIVTARIEKRRRRTKVIGPKKDRKYSTSQISMKDLESLMVGNAQKTRRHRDTIAARQLKREKQSDGAASVAYVNAGIQEGDDEFDDLVSAVSTTSRERSYVGRRSLDRGTASVFEIREALDEVREQQRRTNELVAKLLESSTA